MSSKFTKVAAVAASTMLVVSGASAANAQSLGVEGQIDLGSLKLGGAAQVDPTVPGTDPAPKAPANGSLGSLSGAGAGNTGGQTPAQGGNQGSMDSGSLKAYGFSPDSGSLLQPVNATGVGSLDTTNSSLGEPTLGSLANLASQASGSVNISNPKPGTGSVDTSGSALLREPTTGSLAGLWAPVSASLGTNEGITTVLGSTGSGSGSLPAGSLPAGSLPAGSLPAGSLPAGAGSLAAVLPIVLVGGSIAAGIAAAPLIQQALANANFQIPGLPQITLPAIPGLPPLPGGSLNMPQPPAKAPQGPNAPGPGVNNGRG